MTFLKDLAISAVIILMLVGVWIAIPIVASIGVVLFLGFIIYVAIQYYKEFKEEENQDK